MFPSGKSFPAQSVQDGRATFTQLCCCFWILYASLVAQTVKNLPAIQETQVRSLDRKDPVKKEMATHSSILAKENPLDRGAWWATVHGGHKESDTTEWLALSTWILYRIWAPFRALLASLQAQTVKNLPAMRETWVRSLGQKSPWRRAWQPTPVFLPGEFHGQRSLAGYSPWGCKELDTTEQLLLTHSHSGPSTVSARVYSWSFALNAVCSCFRKRHISLEIHKL